MHTKYIDRRQKLALDKAYTLYKQMIKGEAQPDLYLLANSLTTLCASLNDSCYSQFKMTKRLWRRIYYGLCDLLITSFPVYVIIYDQDGRLQTPFEPIREPAIVEIHAQGLRRKTDIFSIDLEELNPLTRQGLEKVWLDSGPMLKPDDFKDLECGEFCTFKNFLVGDEVLTKESELGKERAYKRWWELYWQAYCAPTTLDQQLAQQEMHTLEQVWGNLYY